MTEQQSGAGSDIDERRRDILKGPILGAVGLIGFSFDEPGVRAQTRTRQDDSLVFSESFESVPVGTFPSTWERTRGESQRVVAETASDGNRSLRQQGTKGCQPAGAAHPLELREATILRITGAVKPIADESGNCFEHRGKIALRTDGDDRGEELTLLALGQDGTVTGVNGTGFGDYSVDEWTAFGLEIERNSGQLRVSYTVDGADRGSTSLPSPSFVSTLSHLFFSSGSNTVYWDELRAESTTIADSDATIQGRVTGPEGDPVSGATVRIPLSDNPLETTTGVRGQFAIDIGDRTVPETVTLLVEAEGYVTGSTNVSTSGASDVAVRLVRSGVETVQISEEIHHLGDGDFSGQINSQFQESVEGDSVSRTFSLVAEQTQPDRAELVYTIRGAQEDNRLYLNGEQVGTTATSDRDGTVSEQRLTVDPDVLIEGENSFTVESADNPDSYNDIDDFEISNVRLVLQGVNIDITLELQDVRLVQTVEKTTLDIDDDGAPERNPPDPDLVLGRATTAVFDIEGSNLEFLGGQGAVEIAVMYSDGRETETYRREFAPGTLAATIDNPNYYGPLRFLRALFGESELAAYPTFEATEAIETVEVTLAVEGAGIEATVSVDPEFVSTPAFRLGVIGLENTDAYGTLNGRRSFRSYQDLTIEHAKQIQRMFPTDRVELYYQHLENAIAGSGSDTELPFTDGTIGMMDDIVDARLVLEEQLPAASGDAENGTVTVIENGVELPRSAREDVTISETDGGFDATFAIVPEGYFDYHSYGDDGDGNVTGVHYGAVLANPAGQSPLTPLVSEVADETTGAHEVGHHLLGSFYDGDLAQVEDDESLDHAHANEDALESVTYDIEDGTLDGRSFDSSSPSLMSYGIGRWADALAYQHHIDEEFRPTPDEVGERVLETARDAGEAADQLFQVVAAETEDGIELLQTKFRESGLVTTIEDGLTTVRAKDIDGNVLAEHAIPAGVEAQVDRQTQVASQDKRLIVGTVPVPEQTAAVEVRTEGQDGETRSGSTMVQSQTLIDLVRSLPPAAFEADREDTVGDVIGNFENGGEAIRNENFQTAISEFETAKSTLDAELRAYDAAPNQPTKDTVITQISQRIDWLRDRRAESDDEKASLLRQWGPIVGGVGGSALAAGGAYRYLSDDNESTAAGGDTAEDGSTDREAQSTGSATSDESDAVSRPSAQGRQSVQSEPASAEQRPAADTQPHAIGSYDDFIIGDLLNVTGYARLNRATAQGETLWVLRPVTGNDGRVHPDGATNFTDRIEPWTTMDAHANLLAVRGHGTDPVPWLALDAGECPSLLDVADQYTQMQLLWFVKQACDAVVHVHQQGSVYANITPSSLLVDADGQIRLLGAVDSVWDENVSWYTAPAQLNGEATARTVVYRMGLVTYELLTGELPFSAYPDANPAAAVGQSAAIPVTQRRRLQTGVADVLERALADNPTDRYRDVASFRDALSGLLE